MRTRFIFGLLIYLIVSSQVFGQNIDNINFMTENYPPYNMYIDNKLQGIAVDLLVEIFNVMNSSQRRDDIALLPWVRGYMYAQIKPNSCLFSTTRTAARETLFKWAGPIAPTRISVFALKSRHLKIKSRNDLIRYNTGVIRDDIGDQLAEDIGIKEIHRVSNINSNIGMLLKKRIDVWIYEETVAKWHIKTFGYDSGDFEVVYVLSEGDLYYAFQKNTPSIIINQFQSALDQLISNGTYQKVLDRYLK
jgi:ABC-type amino acid transport substrate-binding protein